METSAGIRYKRETATLVRRFKGGHITFPACIAALDAALAKVILTLDKDELPDLRNVMIANNAEVMKEMERRGPQKG